MILLYGGASLDSGLFCAFELQGLYGELFTEDFKQSW